MVIGLIESDAKNSAMVSRIFKQATVAGAIRAYDADAVIFCPIHLPPTSKAHALTSKPQTRSVYK